MIWYVGWSIIFTVSPESECYWCQLDRLFLMWLQILLLKILRCNRGISDMAHFYKMSYFMVFAAFFFFDLAHKDDGRALRWILDVNKLLYTCATIRKVCSKVVELCKNLRIFLLSSCLELQGNCTQNWRKLKTLME